MDNLASRTPRAEKAHQDFLKRCEISLMDLNHLEAIIWGAMTNFGEYKVDDSGEHAAEIARAVFLNGYRRNLP